MNWIRGWWCDRYHPWYVEWARLNRNTDDWRYRCPKCEKRWFKWL